MNRTSGFSLFELLIVLMLVSVLGMLATPLTMDWYQERYALRMIADLHQALQQGEAEAFASGESMYLVPCIGCRTWSQGIALLTERAFLSHDTTDVRYEWHWPHTLYHLSWHGFIAKHFLRFSSDLGHAAMNGYFDLHSPQKHWKVIVNRLGYPRVEEIGLSDG